MKKLLLLLLLCSLGASAQTTTQYSRVQYRYSLTYSYNIPLGQFSAADNNRFLTGRYTPVSGANFYIGFLLPSRFALGLRFSQATYHTNADQLYAHLRDRYQKPGYYTTIDIKDRSYNVGTTALEVSYIYHRYLDIEPYVLVGLGYPSENIYGGVYTIRQKQKNSNYSDDVIGNTDRKAFFFPGVGLRVNKKIWGVIHITAGVQYNYGVSKYTLNEVTTDFIGNKSAAAANYSQPVSVLQAQAGVEIRFRAKRHFKALPPVKP